MIKGLLVSTIILLTGCATGSLSTENIGLHVEKDKGISASELKSGNHCAYTVVNKDSKNADYSDCVWAAYENEVLIYNADSMVSGIGSLARKINISDIQAFAVAALKPPLAIQVQMYIHDEIVVLHAVSHSGAAEADKNTREFIAYLNERGVKEIESRGAIEKKIDLYLFIPI